jgi:hypothetical protein
MNNNGAKAEGHGIVGYGSPYGQNFTPSAPASQGIAQPIPNNQQGITAQPIFHKINKTLAPGPVAKIVIALQQARF